LHARGVVHRDLKPDNIIVGQVDGRDHAWLVDFGVCKLLPAWYADLEFRTEPGLRLQTEAGAFLGTPGYASARDAENDDELRDVFGLAATLFRCLTGRMPYKQAPPQEGAEIEWFASDDRLPRALKWALEFALMVDPKERCPSIEVFEARLRVPLDDLEADEAGVDGGGSKPSGHGESSGPQAGARSSRNLPIALAAGAGLVLLGWLVGLSQGPAFSPSQTAIAWAARLPPPEPVAVPAESAVVSMPQRAATPPQEDAMPEEDSELVAPIPPKMPATSHPQRDPVRSSRQDALSAATDELGRCLPTGESATIELKVGLDGKLHAVSVDAPTLPSVAKRCLERRLDRISFKPGRTSTHQLKL